MTLANTRSRTLVCMAPASVCVVHGVGARSGGEAIRGLERVVEGEGLASIGRGLKQMNEKGAE